MTTLPEIAFNKVSVEGAELDHIAQAIGGGHTSSGGHFSKQASELLREDAGLRRLRDQARSRPGYDVNVRLGQAVAQGLRRQAAAAGAEAVRKLAALADGTCSGQESDACVLNVSFLVPRDRVARFGALADDLDVPRAVQIAEEAGGAAARTLLRVLKLDEAPVTR